MTMLSTTGRIHRNGGRFQNGMPAGFPSESWPLSRRNSGRIGSEYATEQAEYLATYPPGLSNRDFIKAIYQNLFDRNPDAEGWNYWEGYLNNGAPRDTFILAVINGAYAPTGGAEDRALLNNKHNVSLYYTEQLTLYPLEGLDQNIDAVLNRVTSDPATAIKAMEVIDYVMEQPVSLTGLLQDAATWGNLWAL